ncbi:M23 family metallopeptidase [Wenzhouxiangella marina]|uniref:Putative peptidase n=1 Tax=Wenzhouxiangella marina TaxID=1579979 RepID=A0A0K0XU50_9GAMM|nr:M23 family metallopeptidase [Wenzhouxiangella marina]AKS41162.1 Putative peptidase [Wenzhouxiangella marina]MBB6088041.1 hypothetical protein [Wenzhouxiangella marina]
MELSVGTLIGQALKYPVLVLCMVGAIPALHADPIESVLAHPPVDAIFTCSEHFDGQFQSLGDALGADCIVMRLETEDERTWVRPYRDQGLENEDWYGWRQPLFSPCDCTVTAVHINETTNVPGRMTPGRASSIRLQTDNGTNFVLAHLREVEVEVGDRVQAGQVIARIGNNGYSRSPHLHIGAWRGETPLQIRFDQRKMRLPPEFREQD